MESDQVSVYRPSLQERARVRMIREGDRNYMNTATVMSALPNPSGQRENQWYDVKFDNGVWGRFLERYLGVIEPASKTSAA